MLLSADRILSIQQQQQQQQQKDKLKNFSPRHTHKHTNTKSFFWQAQQQKCKAWWIMRSELWWVAGLPLIEWTKVSVRISSRDNKNIMKVTYIVAWHYKWKRNFLLPASRNMQKLMCIFECVCGCSRRKRSMDDERATWQYENIHFVLLLSAQHVGKNFRGNSS